MNITIETEYGNIKIIQKDGDICIDLDEEVAVNTTINCLNSGIPGVVGPDIPFSLQEEIEKICADCSQAAYDFVKISDADSPESHS